MKLLDWYILKKFFKTFLFSLLLLNVVIIVIDLSEKADDFVKTKFTISKLITDYYFGFLPRINAMLFPLFVFVSVVTFTSSMANKSEIIAILSSGVTYKRMLRPFLIGGLVLSGILWWGNQRLIPKANEKFADFDNRYIKFNVLNDPHYSTLNNYYFRMDANSYAGIRFYDTTIRKGSIFFIEKFQDNKLAYNLRAETITWDTSTNKWRLDRVLERSINGLNETLKQTPVMQVKYNFKPRDLQRDDYMKDKMSTSDLNEYIKLEKLRGSETVNSLLVEKYNRDAIPASVLLLTLIAAILASGKRKGGSGYHLLIGFIICFSYILISKITIVFALKGNFNGFLAAWIPNFFFGIIAWYLYKIAPK